MSAQHGVGTVEQLRQAGLGNSTVRAHASIGRLHRIHQGVYALMPPRLLGPNGRRMAAVLAGGPGAALSHDSAAAHHGLLPATGNRLHVTAPVPGSRKRPNLTIHRSTTLRESDVIRKDNITTTTPARTLLDLAEHLPTQRLTRALDRAITLNLFDLHTLHEQLRHNHARLTPTARLTRALAAYEPLAAPDWYEVQERFLTLVQAAGLPTPQVQPHLDLHDGELMIRPDFCWPERRLIAEVDGWRWHGGRQDFESDRRRDQRAAAAGYRTLRFTKLQLTGEPTRVISTLCACAA